MNMRYIGPVKLITIGPDGKEHVLGLQHEEVLMHFKMDQEPQSGADAAKSRQDALLQERGSEYSDAWLLTGEVVRFITEKRPDALGALVIDTQYILPWLTILCKLLRALQSPRKADHWRDIAGYAVLVAEHIETGSRGR